MVNGKYLLFMYIVISIKRVEKNERQNERYKIRKKTNGKKKEKLSVERKSIPCRVGGGARLRIAVVIVAAFIVVILNSRRSPRRRIRMAWH